MNANYSEWGLREAVAELGYPVNHKQFCAYLQAGLLPTRDDVGGRWSAKEVQKLVEIRKLGRKVRPLPRRVLLLRRDYTEFPIPATKLQQAMLAVLPTIRAPRRKMTRMYRAIVWWHQQSAQFPAATARSRPGDPPRSEEWRALLHEADFERFESEIHMAYYAISAVLPLFTKGTDHDLSDIPFEERVTLWVLRELAQARALQQWANRLSAPPTPTVED